jgi:uncharacterized protein YyaL (SSP411 family)
MTGEDAYAERATRTLQAFSQRYAALRAFAAPYAAAVARALWGGASVAIVGSAASGGAFREAALGLADPLVTTVSFAPGEVGLTARGFEAGSEPRAYPCRGRVCGAPVLDAANLPDAFAALGEV